MKKYKIVYIAISILIILAGIIFIYNFYKQDNKLPHTDINQDGKTDSLDWQMVQEKYGKICAGCPEDINGDNKVDGIDFSLLLGQINIDN